MTPAFTFEVTYERSLWSNRETKSGPGSTRAYTRQIRRSIPLLLDLLDCRSLLDAPCGDFNWMKAMPLGGRSYIGADLVRPLIETLHRTHPEVDFRVLDITCDPLPDADLWLCRDILFHLSLTDVQKVIDNFRRSNIKYLATSHFLQCDVNEDDVTGPTTYCMRNLSKPPFNLPQPDYCLKDYVTDDLPRWLAVWKRTDLLEPPDERISL